MDVLDNNICKVHTKQDGKILVSFFTIMDFVLAVWYMAPSHYMMFIQATPQTLLMCNGDDTVMPMD